MAKRRAEGMSSALFLSAFHVFSQQTGSPMDCCLHATPMAPGGNRVVLINFPQEEVRGLKELFSEQDLELEVCECASVADSEAILAQEGLILVILRADEEYRRPDQDVRRLKRLLGRPVPLLLLVTPDHSRKVKEYLRAGADEYWILPLDSTAFPPRLQVLLEWGQAVATSPASPPHRRRFSAGAALRQALARAWNSLVNLIPLGKSEADAVQGVSSLIGTKWEKVRRLGFGSYGEVWLVREVGGEALAVAKVPHSVKLNTKSLREAAILRRLAGHPNAVQLKGVVKEDDRVILIQEYIEGSTLEEMLGQGMDSAIKERAFLQLLEVMSHAHRQKIMHRDIKPDNIIVTRSGGLKLLDFGTGKDLTRRSISNTITGSRPYMAPEQIMGQSRITSDVWAMGVILYALATGFLPFYDDNEKQLMDMILETAPERPRNLEPGLPEELESIILRCLEKDWTRRYRDAVELREEVLAKLPGFGNGEALSEAG
jgi:hypothetical protein